MSADKLIISDEELKSIHNAISTRYGLDFSQYEPVSLKRRIVRIIHKFDLDGVIGLWRKLLYEPEFIHKFRDEIAIGLTEMFRNPDLWQFMKNDLLPQAPQDMSIWHAGISSGEEVYSMAILLHEQKKLGNTSILATDLSSRFVKQATDGVYEKEDFIKYKKNYSAFNPRGNFNNYFSSKEEEEFQFKKDYTSNIEFVQHNVLEEGPDKKFDWILCRNVMIYFNEELKQKTLKKFNSLLKPDGFLIVGYFDSMPDKFNLYFKHHNQGFRIFQKVN